MSDRDDIPIGRLLTRREALALIGLAGAGTLLGLAPTSRARAATLRRFPTCVVRPEQTEGPFFVDEHLNRSDIRSDPATGAVRPGVPLDLTYDVSAIRGGKCTPLAGAIVDVWHCDAEGLYSDVRDRRADTEGQKFLRGYQVTDASGRARFLTIYPGWYSGRTVHIHFKIRSGPHADAHEFTSQLYFDDALTDRVHQRAPYAARGQRRTRNRMDGIYRDGGEQLLLAPVEKAHGFASTFEIGLDLA